MGASRGDKELVKKMILEGQDVNSSDYTGCTALHSASTNGHVELFELLMRAGAKVNTRDNNVSLYISFFNQMNQLYFIYCIFNIVAL